MIHNLKLSESELAADIWPGHVNVDPAGVRLAADMLAELQAPPCDIYDMTDPPPFTLEDDSRQGLPFRNIVAEYLARAREAGAQTEAGFCAVLTDLAHWTCQGAGRGDWATAYREMYGIE
jgi:hypothetical protein